MITPETVATYSALSLAVYANVALLKLQNKVSTLSSEEKTETVQYKPAPSTQVYAVVDVNSQSVSLQNLLTALSDEALTFVDSKALIAQGFASLASLVDALKKKADSTETGLNTLKTVTSTSTRGFEAALKDVGVDIDNLRLSVASMSGGSSSSVGDSAGLTAQISSLRASLDSSVQDKVTSQLIPIQTVVGSLASSIDTLKSIIASQSGQSYAQVASSTQSNVTVQDIQNIKDSIVAISTQLSSLNSVKPSISLLRGDMERVTTNLGEEIVLTRKGLNDANAQLTVVQDSLRMVGSRIDGVRTDINKLYAQDADAVAALQVLKNNDNLIDGRLILAEQGLRTNAAAVTAGVQKTAALTDYTQGVLAPKVEQLSVYTQNELVKVKGSVTTLQDAVAKDFDQVGTAIATHEVRITSAERVQADAGGKIASMQTEVSQSSTRWSAIDTVLTIRSGVDAQFIKPLTTIALSTTSLSVAGVSNSHMPRGGIIMWSGTIAKIPIGWVLCDGVAMIDGLPVPDLRGKFIMAAGQSNLPGSQGGSATILESNLPAHTHTINIVAGGSHTHTVDEGGLHAHATIANATSSTTTYTTGAHVATAGTAGSDSKYSMCFSETNPTRAPTSDSGKHTHAMGAAGSHSHTATADKTGGGTPYYPPYFALAYIIKL